MRSFVVIFYVKLYNKYTLGSLNEIDSDLVNILYVLCVLIINF